MASARAARRPANRKNPKTLVAIAVFKLVKGVLLVAVGIGALKLLHKDVAQTVLHWVDVLRVDPDNRFSQERAILSANNRSGSRGSDSEISQKHRDTPRALSRNSEFRGFPFVPSCLIIRSAAVKAVARR
jgi:hypothetical protein